MPEIVLVTGAGGFIGGHLVAELRRQGQSVRAVDCKPLADWYQTFPDVENQVADLQLIDACRSASLGAREIYQLAADSSLESHVISALPRLRGAGISDAAEAMRSLWRLAGIGDFSLVRVRHTKNFLASEPVDSLHAYYTSAAARYGIEWSYLAAINYVESDFGRVNGPSSAGALGPMQFLPST